MVPETPSFPAFNGQPNQPVFPSMQMRQGMVNPIGGGRMMNPSPLNLAEMFHQFKMTMTPNAYFQGKKFFMNSPNPMMPSTQLEYYDFLLKQQQIMQKMRNPNNSSTFPLY